MKIYIFIILAAATSTSLISCDSNRVTPARPLPQRFTGMTTVMIIGKVMETTIVK